MKAILAPVTVPAIRLFCSAVALASFTATVAAQSPLAAAAEGRNAPGGTVVMALHAGVRVTVVSTRGANALVTLAGWVDASRLAGKLDTFPASVDTKAPLRVRASAALTSAILAELRPRTGVHPMGKSGTWTRIKRSAWIPASALSKAAFAAPAAPPKSAPPKSAAAKPVAAAPVESAAASPPVPSGAMAVSKSTKLRSAPAGSALGELAAGTVVQTLAKDHGFTKVRIEGWISERELVPADSSYGSQLTAADLRADPEGTHGKMVQWEVEILSLQTADPLRRDLARDEPYLLAKGPGTENALLYLAVPPSLLNQAKGLPPLTRVLITARVRVGRSEPVGTPILDLKSISKR